MAPFLSENVLWWFLWTTAGLETLTTLNKKFPPTNLMQNSCITFVWVRICSD